VGRVWDGNLPPIIFFLSLSCSQRRPRAIMLSRTALRQVRPSSGLMPHPVLRPIDTSRSDETMLRTEVGNLEPLKGAARKCRPMVRSLLIHFYALRLWRGRIDARQPPHLLGQNAQSDSGEHKSSNRHNSNDVARQLARGDTQKWQITSAKYCICATLLLSREWHSPDTEAFPARPS